MHLLHKLLDVAAGNRHGSPENDDCDYPKNDFNRAGLAIVELGEMLPFPKGLVLYCSSFSKTLAPDFRVGWILPGRFRERILRLKFNASIAQGKLPQLIIADFLETGQYERHLRKLRIALKNQVSNTAQAIARVFPQGTKLTAPTGGYVLWVQLAENVDGVELFRLAKAEKIFIIPGAITTGTGRCKNCIRISCGTPWGEQMEDGMRRLGVLVSRLQAR